MVTGEIKSKSLNDSVSTAFVPFVLEVTGSFDPSGSSFVKPLVASVPVPEGEDDPKPPASARFNPSHSNPSNKLRRLVERITSAAHRKTSHVLSTYHLRTIETAAATAQL